MRYRVALIAPVLVVLALFAWADGLWLVYGAITTRWRLRALEYLPSWLLLFLLSYVLGFLISVLGRPNRPLTVCFSAGVFLSLLIALFSTIEFTAEATVATHVWVYGMYFMAPLGALTGASTAVRLARRPAHAAV